MTEWRSRIVGHGEADPKELTPNRDNWRNHPTIQRRVLASILEQIGLVQSVVVNQRTGNLIDGHLRIELALERGEATVPVTYVDVSHDEERAILATFDGMSKLATANPTTFDSLIARLKADQPATKDDLNELRWLLIGKPVETLEYGPGDKGLTVDDKKERYDRNPLRQIVVHLLPDEYQEIEAMLTWLGKHLQADSHSAVVAQLIHEAKEKIA